MNFNHQTFLTAVERIVVWLPLYWIWLFFAVVLVLAAALIRFVFVALPMAKKLEVSPKGIFYEAKK